MPIKRGVPNTPNVVHVGYVGFVQVQAEESRRVNNVSSSSSIQQAPDVREQEFSRLLECPVCFAIPQGAVFNCEKGHSICENCRAQLSKCVLCSGSYTEARNFTVESVISFLLKYGVSLSASPTPNRMLRRCVYQAEGCQAVLLAKQMDSHLLVCQFSPVKCNVDSSGKCSPTPYLKLSEYFYHLKNQHKIDGLAEASGVFTKVDRLFVKMDINVNWPPFYMLYDGKTFLRYASIRNRNMSFWVHLIGSEREASKYQAVVSLHSPNQRIMKISWTVPVHAIRRPRHEVEQSKGLASISTNRLVPYCAIGETFGDRIANYTWSCKIILSRIE